MEESSRGAGRAAFCSSLRLVRAGSFLPGLGKSGDQPFQSMFQQRCNSERPSLVTSVEAAVMKLIVPLLDS